MSGGLEETRIVIVVPATSETQAIARTRVAINHIEITTRPAHSFSEILLFEGANRPYLRDQWGDLPTATPSESEVGEELIADAIAETEDEFQATYEAVKELLEYYTANEIMENKDLVRNQFLALGAFVGPSIRLYAHKGRALRTQSELTEYLEAYRPTWVVPAVALS